MLTVKHVELNGQEKIVPVQSISYNKNELIGYGRTEDEVLVRCASGHAYVMNDQGKTVGVYSLGK